MKISRYSCRINSKKIAMARHPAQSLSQRVRGHNPARIKLVNKKSLPKLAKTRQRVPSGNQF
jgi:hypothetical protein